MRPIKFRAWKKATKVMVEDALEISNIGLGEGSLVLNTAVQEDTELIWMEFTGLLDKQGTEIYDGDLLKYANAKGQSYGNYLHQVVYQDTKARFALKIIGAKETEMPRQFVGNQANWDNSRFEVIGNIYSNPELLKV